MKAGKLGMLSAVVASVCCVGPVILVLGGLGSLGVGVVLGRYHWWFIGTAIGLLAFAWSVYFRERRRCQATRCEMEMGRTTTRLLLSASAVVAIFVGLNLYTYASPRRKVPTMMQTSEGRFARVAIPVEGMTCFTCELTVESALRGISGVQSSDAKVTEGAVYVTYDPNRVSWEELIAAINKTGYRASRPTE